MLAVILNQHLIKKERTGRMQKPRIPPHPTTKQEILFLRRMGFPAQKKMKGFVKDGDPGIDELLNKTDKYGADVIAQAYVNVAKRIGKEDVWQMTKIDEAFNFEHPVFEREFDFIRSRDPEADAALDFLDMEMGRER